MTDPTDHPLGVDRLAEEPTLRLDHLDELSDATGPACRDDAGARPAARLVDDSSC